MPIYEYECPKCGGFEVTQRITEPPLKKCPTCKSTKLKKLISNTSFQLKGSGWYVTDYARKDGGGGKSTEKSDSKNDSKSESSSKESSAKSSDTKNSSKTEKASQAA